MRQSEPQIREEGLSCNFNCFASIIYTNFNNSPTKKGDFSFFFFRILMDKFPLYLIA